MASLTPSRSAMSLSRPSLLRRTLVPRRANLTFMRERTALQENDEPLNQNPTDSDIDQAKPRWSYTPPALKAAYDFQLKEAKDPRNSVWHVNEDPAKLEAFYERFLGARSGARMLPEELRWLAVTHKSFDYGRRGFNTKLAYFGRQIIVHEAMNEIMTSHLPVEDCLDDPWKRKHFRSPALTNVDKLSAQRPARYVTIKALAKLGYKSGLTEVVRWKPRNTRDLDGAGIQIVLSTSIFAIVGAVSLQHGAEVASNIARESVLKRITRGNALSAR